MSYCNISITNNTTFEVKSCHEVDNQVALEGVSQNQLVISRRLGHSKPSMTMDIYGHLMPGRQRQAAESFANAMKAIS